METILAVLAILIPTGAITSAMERAANTGRAEFSKLPGPAKVAIAVVVGVAWSVAAPALGLSFDLSNIPQGALMAGLAGLVFNVAKPLLGPLLAKLSGKHGE